MPTNTLYIDHHGTGLKVDEVFYGDPGDLYKRLALLADHETDPKNREEELIQLGLSIAPFEPSNIDPELRAIEAVDRLISKDLEYFVKLGEVFESKCLELSQKASFIENTAILEFPQNFEYKLIWPVLHYIRLKRKIKVVIGYKRVKNNIYQVNIVASAPLDAPSIANALRGTNILILSEKALSMRVRKSFLSKISQLAKYL
ncbi:MAG TPA: hypothetical protein ENF55_03450 [Thermoprotei archaeon]|nr:hypothetical protein [Thermoprotei archaeon]